MKKLFYYLLAIVMILAFLGVGLVLIDKIQKERLGADIPVTEQLKVDKEMILSVNEFKEDGVDKVSYNYVSEVEVPKFSKTEGKKVIEEDLSKRTDNSITFDLGEGKFESRIYGGIPFYKDGATWKQTEFATTTKASFDEQTKPTLVEIVKSFIFDGVWADTVTSAPTVDGYAGYNNATGPTWANILVQNGNANNTAGTVFYVPYIQADTAANTWVWLTRSKISFNTSGLPDTAVISASTLYLYGNTKGDTFTTDLASIVQIYGSADTTDAIANSSYENASSTVINAKPYSTGITYASFNGSAYNTFALNADGIANIQLTTTTKFSIKDSYYDNARNVPTWESGKVHSIEVRSAETAGTSSDPYISITYTVPAVVAGVSKNAKVIIVD